MENQMFTVKEDLRRIDFENEKNVEDRRHMAD
jgi:hypothetical protein